jgi:DNA polymerase-3 subunit epsilon
MATFTAIDFETAQGKRWSICQVGLVRVENRTIREKLVYWSVSPPGNICHPMNTQIQGISTRHTQYVPTFATR